MDFKEDSSNIWEDKMVSLSFTKKKSYFSI